MEKEQDWVELSRDTREEIRKKERRIERKKEKCGEAG